MGHQPSHGRADREVVPEAAPHLRREGSPSLALLPQGTPCSEEHWPGLQGPSQGQGGPLHRQEVPVRRSGVDPRQALGGVVHRTFMKNTITIRRDYLHYQKKYRRYEKRHKMISAHCSPAFDARPGDEVIIGECRPLSKTVRFNVLEVHEKVSRLTSSAGGKAAK